MKEGRGSGEREPGTGRGGSKRGKREGRRQRNKGWGDEEMGGGGDQ
jgi:hypothetical protein